MMKDAFQEDPLHEILERHLVGSSAEQSDLNQLVNSIIADYVRTLESQGVSIPAKLKTILIQDLKEEVKELILKKTPGAANLKVGPAPVASRLPRKVA